MIKFSCSPSYISSEEWVSNANFGVIFFYDLIYNVTGFDSEDDCEVYDYLKICTRDNIVMNPLALSILILEYKEAFDYTGVYKNRAYSSLCACVRFLRSEYRACPSSDIVNIIRFWMFGACALGCYDLQLELMEGIQKYFGGVTPSLEML